MKRFVLLGVTVVALAAPAGAQAFHHGATPVPQCAEASQAGANPTAREAILERNPQKNPGRTFPPFGTPGESQGQGGEHCEGRDG